MYASLRLTRHAFASQKWLGALGSVFVPYEAISYEGRAARGWRPMTSCKSRRGSTT